jgi:hypothetical protein
MQLDDPFPVERFPQKVRDAILVELGGRCPTVRDVLIMPDDEWLKVPGIGPVALAKLRQVTKNLPQKPLARALAGWTDAELMAEHDRLLSELVRLRKEVLRRQSRLRTMTAELRLREIVSREED